MYAKNADFTQADNQNVSESNGLIVNGKLWIGSTIVNAGGTHINVGGLTSPDGSVTIGYSNPNITLQAAAAFPFIDQATSITLATNTGYYATAAVTLTMPASPSQGDLVIIFCDTASSVVVTANTGQKIRLGNQISSTAGTQTNTAQGDCMSLRYRSATSTWQCVSSMGNWTPS